MTSKTAILRNGLMFLKNRNDCKETIVKYIYNARHIHKKNLLKVLDYKVNILWNVYLKINCDNTKGRIMSSQNFNKNPNPIIEYVLLVEIWNIIYLVLVNYSTK